MTPAELVTRNLISQIQAFGATVGVEALLVEALEGARHEAPSSGVTVRVTFTSQNAIPFPLYAFRATATLTTAIDDDKSGSLFVENYNALWNAFDFLSRESNCDLLGDESSETDAHVFGVDAFQLESGDGPDFSADDNGGAWTCSFTALITGRALSTPTATTNATT